MSDSKPERPPPPRRPHPPMSTGQIPVEVLPLLPHEIRWFYKEPGRYWIPFNGFDSLTLEERYQRIANGEAGSDMVQAMLTGVLGDTYEANVLERVATPVYWKVPEIKLLRSEWFEVSADKWYPIAESEARHIELAHCNTTWRTKYNRDVGLDALVTGSATVNASRVIRHKLTMEKHEVVWYGDCEIWRNTVDYSSKMLRAVGKTLMGKGENYGGKQLRRGYWDICRPEDRLPPIGHIVFVIHGIGQCMDGSDVCKSTSELRETCQKVAKKQFDEQWKQARVEFIPVEWRTWLKLDEGLVDSLTLPNIPKFRQIANSSILDVLYYLSPTYGPEMLSGLRLRINQQYKVFIDRNPNYVEQGGVFSVAAHSLGSVIMYDILSSRPTDDVDFDDDEDKRKQLEELQEARLRVQQLEAALLQRKSPDAAASNRLLFQLEHLFALGSPLGVFLALRDVEERISRHLRSAQSLLPASACKRIHNLHHPSDPVAYRLEPLVNIAYERVKPVKVDRCSTGPSSTAQELAIGPRCEEEIPLVEGKKGWMSYLPSFSKASMTASVTKSNSGSGTTSDKMMKDDSNLPAKDKLYERLDYQLQEATMSSSYINVLTSHTCYWTSSDVAMFLLLQIFKYRPSAPPPSAL